MNSNVKLTNDQYLSIAKELGLATSNSPYKDIIDILRGTGGSISFKNVSIGNGAGTMDYNQKTGEGSVTVTSGSVGGITVRNNSKVHINISGGTIGFVDAGNSDLVIKNTGGKIDEILTYNSNGNLMHAVMFNAANPQPSVLSISSNPVKALNNASGALGAMSGGGKATGQIYSSGAMVFSMTNPANIVGGINAFANSPTGQKILEKAGQLLVDVATLIIGAALIYDSATRTYETTATNYYDPVYNPSGTVIVGGTSLPVTRTLDDVLNDPTYKEIPGIDCAEIAEELYRVNNKKGTIYNIIPMEVGWLKLNIYNYGSIIPVNYHNVYSYEGAIYDPRHSTSPVLKDVYFSELSIINPLGFYVFELRLGR